MECEKAEWVQKYVGKALDFWRCHEYTFEVSEDYCTQLADDLAKQYDDPLKRQFVEMLWT